MRILYSTEVIFARTSLLNFTENIAKKAIVNQILYELTFYPKKIWQEK